MRVTVCELPEDCEKLEHTWYKLAEHVARERSELVVLPAMPFARSLVAKRSVSTQDWRGALRAHDEWEARLHELAPAIVASTRPMDFGNERYEEAFLWEQAVGFRGVHAKCVLRDGPGYREASWYTAAVPDFVPQELNGIEVGFLLDAELDQLEEAECYGREGVQLLLAPRCTETNEHWLEAGRRAAASAHAYLLSSNRAGSQKFAGDGWIIGPEGKLLGRTREGCPFLSMQLDVRPRVALVPGLLATDKLQPLPVVGSMC